MRNNRKTHLNNNSGIAMITIVIAVAFVSIVGAALLYVTFTNFQMKVLNLKSRTNFYETDGELVRFSTTLRNQAKKPSDLDSMITGLADVPGEPGVQEGTYNLSSILPLAGISSNPDVRPNGDTFVYDVTGTVRVASSGDVTNYEFKDISVTQTAKNQEAKNNVKTNLQITIKKQTASGGGKKGVGECSMLFDAPLKVSSNGQYSFLSLYGDAFYSSYVYDGSGKPTGTFPGVGGTGTYTMPGKFNMTDPAAEDSKPALYLTGNARLNLIADYMVVYGDLVLTDYSCLYIGTGNLTVYGDIYLLGNSNLVCGGTIYQPSAIMPGRSQRCGFVFDNGVVPEAAVKQRMYYSGISGKTAPYYAEEVEDDNVTAFCNVLHLDDNDEKNDGIAPSIVRTIKYQTTNHGTNNNFSVFKDYKEDKNIKISADYYGQPCGVAFQTEDVINADYNNYLVFIAEDRDDIQTTTSYIYGESLDHAPWYINYNPPHAVTTTSATQTRIVSSNIGSTFVSETPLVLDVQHGSYISKMTSPVYDYLTIESNNSTAPYYNESIHKFTFDLGGNLASGDKNKISAGDLLKTDANDTVSNMFSYGINGGSGVPKYINSVLFKGYVKDAD